MKNKFSETKFGQILKASAPSIFNLVGDVFPPANILKTLILNDPEISDYEKENLFKELQNYEIEKMKYEFEDRQSARNMYTSNSIQSDKIATSIMRYNLPLILILVLINVFVVLYLDKVLIAIIANVIGMVLQSLISERQALINFFFGSSEGSKSKTELFENFKTPQK